jgi:hypothetical protein
VIKRFLLLIPFPDTVCAILIIFPGKMKVFCITKGTVVLYPERIEPRGDRFSLKEFSDLKALKSYFPINPS